MQVLLSDGGLLENMRLCQLLESGFHSKKRWISRDDQGTYLSLDLGAGYEEMNIPYDARTSSELSQPVTWLDLTLPHMWCRWVTF